MTSSGTLNCFHRSAIISDTLIILLYFCFSNFPIVFLSGGTKLSFGSSMASNFLHIADGNVSFIIMTTFSRLSFRFDRGTLIISFVICIFSILSLTCNNNPFAHPILPQNNRICNTDLPSWICNLFKNFDGMNPHSSL